MSIYNTLKQNFYYKFITDLVPFASYLQLSLKEFSKGSIIMDCKVRKELTNHVASLHAGAGFSILETVAGGCLVSCFPNISEISVLLAESSISYFYPGLDNVIAKACIPSEKQKEMHLDINSGKAIKIEIKSDLWSVENKKIAEAKFLYSLKKMEEI